MDTEVYVHIPPRKLDYATNKPELICTYCIHFPRNRTRALCEFHFQDRYHLDPACDDWINDLTGETIAERKEQHDDTQ